MSAVVKSATNMTKKVINWYPGHMFTGMKAMMGKLSSVDCIIEIHDARLPFTGRNTELKRSLGAIKPHILVLNKCDLADLSRWDEIEERLRHNGDTNVIRTSLTGNSFDHANRGYDKLAQLVVDVVRKSDRYNREGSNQFKTMIVGIPNVGKSSIINRLRQIHLGVAGTPAIVGSQAGVTKHVMQTIKICSKPPIYVHDTPGILQPNTTKSYPRAMKLAMCSTISDKAVGIEDIARFTLQWLNNRNMHDYIHIMNLESPVENFEEFIVKSALSLKKIERVRDRFTGEEKRLPDVKSICCLFVKSFRNGSFGKVMMEDL